MAKIPADKAIVERRRLKGIAAAILAREIVNSVTLAATAVEVSL